LTHAESGSSKGEEQLPKEMDAEDGRGKKAHLRLVKRKERRFKSLRIKEQKAEEKFRRNTQKKGKKK